MVRQLVTLGFRRDVLAIKVIICLSFIIHVTKTIYLLFVFLLALTSLDMLLGIYYYYFSQLAFTSLHRFLGSQANSYLIFLGCKTFLFLFSRLLDIL